MGKLKRLLHLPKCKCPRLAKTMPRYGRSWSEHWHCLLSKSHKTVHLPISWSNHIVKKWPANWMRPYWRHNIVKTQVHESLTYWNWFCGPRPNSTKRISTIRKWPSWPVQQLNRKTLNTFKVDFDFIFLSFSCDHTDLYILLVCSQWPKNINFSDFNVVIAALCICGLFSSFVEILNQMVLETWRKNTVFSRLLTCYILIVNVSLFLSFGNG